MLIGLTAIIVIGMVAQWISWRFRLPSILILLIFGFLIGPVTNFFNPDEYFGKLLFPFVSISVAVILFEGGLNLRFTELKSVKNVVRNLLIIGIPITWILTAITGIYFLHLTFGFAVLFGAIFVVTGPTVILPLLRHIRPNAQINSILKWEGIINDPIGALLAILVFEVLLSGGFQEATLQVVTGLLKTVLLSCSVGLAGAYVMMLLIKHRMIPDFLQNTITLSMVVLVFAGSNLIQSESGLFAVTVMGIFLANQKKISVRHIIEFKENLRILLISILFIVLAARLRVSDINMLGVGSFLFVAAFFLIRPVSVFISTFGSSLAWKEKLYISLMAPRGIVAAAVSSLFTLELLKVGYKDAEIFVPITFLVIVSTITIYGLGAMPLAKWLRVANPNPQGCLILGAHPFAREIGVALKNNGFKILMVDTNWINISAAKNLGLETYHGSIISEHILNDIDLNGIGRLLAITPNEEVNSLAILYFSKLLGSSEVYQLANEKDESREEKRVSKELRGQILFGSGFTYSKLLNYFNEGFTVKSTNITEKFNFEAFVQQKKDDVIPLFVIDEDKNLGIYTSSQKPNPQPGELLVSLIKVTEEEKKQKEQRKLESKKQQIENND